MRGEGESAERSLKGKGGVGRGGGCSFKMAVRLERVVATGGASPLPYEKWVG